MIIAKLNRNIKLYEVDEFVTKFRNKVTNKNFKIDVKLTNTERLIYLFKSLH